MNALVGNIFLYGSWLRFRASTYSFFEIGFPTVWPDDLFIISKVICD